MDFKAVRVCVVAEKFVVVVNRQVAERLAVIKKKTVARVAAVEQFSGEPRQPRNKSIAAPFLKFVAQRRRQLASSIPLSVCRYSSFSGERPSIGDEWLDDGIPIILKRRLS